MSQLKFSTISDSTKFDNLAIEPTDQAARNVAAEKLIFLAEGMNGPNTFDVSKANYGYVKQHERMAIPADLKAKIEQTTKNLTDIKQFYKNGEFDAAMPTSSIDINDLLRIAMCNYACLTRGGIPSEASFFIAILRARLIQNGYLYVNKKERCVTVDEVDWIVDCEDPHKDLYMTNSAYKAKYDAKSSEAEKLLEIVANIADSPYKKFVRYSLSEKSVVTIQHLVLMADQYAAMLYLVFRQHGHHYTPDYEKKYNIMFKATTLAAHPNYPGNENVMRVAMHSFGLKCFHDKFWDLLSCNKLAETFVDRADVAPSGTAVVATCAATFNSMKGVPVWDTIYTMYRESIDQLFLDAEMLKGNNAQDAIKFHKNARLFGKERHQLDPKHAEALATVAKGYIEALGPTSDLYMQKSLDKRAAQNPMMTTVMATIITKIADRLTSDENAIDILAARQNAQSTKMIAASGAASGGTVI